MQSLSWYGRRLGSMSAGEVCWRIRSKGSAWIDRGLMTVRRRPLDARKVADVDGTFRSEAVSLGLDDIHASAALPAACGRWRNALIERADRICENRLSLFDLRDHFLGEPINWNYEYKAGKQAPMTFAPTVDYRDYALTGDCKFVWEPSRHQHLVVLGRAYRLTGNRAYAETVVRHLESWMEQCPFGVGMNWRSPLELGIRLINWVWALELIRPAGVVTAEFRERLLGVVYRHLWEITRKYSRYSSANNHRIGEAAGVFIASSYFQNIHKAAAWQRESRKILLEEMIAQTYADGGTREQAMGYHLFVMEFFLLAGLTARNIGQDFPAAYWQRLEKMFDFLAAFGAGGEQLPMFGDADDGYVLDLGGTDRVGDLLAVGTALLGGEIQADGEPVLWLLGSDAYKQYERIEHSTRDLASRAFPESGYYLLQCGGDDDRISVSFDCGELGFGPIAAHGHADALSFTLRAFGQDVLVDPGTYDYFTDRRWRDYFRSTRAHNTVVVDDQDQSEPLGLFLWGRRANARCTRWEPSANGGTVSGEHDGYSHVPGSVIHRRSLTLDGSSRELVVRDELVGKGTHSAAFYVHLSESCGVRRIGTARFAIIVDQRELAVELDSQWKIEVLEGSLSPIMGWVSRGYHRKSPAITLAGRCAWKDRLESAMRISVSGPKRDTREQVIQADERMAAAAK